MSRELSQQDALLLEASGVLVVELIDDALHEGKVGFAGGEVAASAHQERLLQLGLEDVVALLDGAVFVRLSWANSRRFESVVLEHFTVALGERAAATLELTRRRREVVAPKLSRQSAQSK